MYQVKEIFPTLQGEGAQAGRRAVFCRFAGCNLWSGRESDRESAVCRFCDTDFVGTDGEGGGAFRSAGELAGAIAAKWGPEREDRFVVLTGGEPMLQVDARLIDALHGERFEIAIETNGTLAVPRAIDWICVSPKAGAELVQRSGDELKLVYPQSGLLPADVEDLDFAIRYVQPMDGDDVVANTRAAVAFCRENAGWRLSLQTHKLIGIP
ncbi:MAG: 7-carboxy-7-deazaguanine synthase [Alphaproteobacteria bacterium]|nr:7-carboxy-7-deazaguanine synthase [Alphaproteobacteria bacterium]